MQTVAIAIREGPVQGPRCAGYLRSGEAKELAPQVEMLRKIGATLGVVGLGELRGQVQVETERLQKVVDGTFA